MTEPNETRVSFRVTANFGDLLQKLANYRRSLAATEAAQKKFNAQQKSTTAADNALKKRLTEQATAVRGATKAIQAQNRALLTNARAFTAAAKAAKEYATQQKKISNTSKASRDSANALKAEAAELRRTTAVRGENNKRLKEEAEAYAKSAQEAKKYAEQKRKSDKIAEESPQRKKSSTAKEAVESARALKEETIALREATRQKVKFVKEVGNVNQVTGEVTGSANRLQNAASSFGNSFRNMRGAMSRFRSEGGALDRTFSNVEGGAKRLQRSLNRLGNWRPRLTPPFIALIPLIGSVVAAINPLVAAFGSLIPLTVGLAGNIGSLSGAFLALPGILSGVVAGISSVIASMGGVGSVFKAYSAMQKATNTSSGGPRTSQADRAYELADAERSLAKAQKNVQRAQENLNKAREEALKDLIDLRMEVSRASIDEERAIANLRLAQEAYWDVMADPGSTLGDKMDAAASIKEAEVELQDVRKKNIENAKDLAKAEKNGIENSERVVDAKESLADAIWNQESAQRSLNKTQNPTATGMDAAVKATDEFQEALNKLSPSARAFVLALIAMEDQWKAFRLGMQEAFFSEFVGQLDKLPRILQNVTAYLRPAATAMGELTSSLIDVLSSDEISTDASILGEANYNVIKDLGEGFGFLAMAIKDVAIAAIPFTDWMTNGFKEGSENFADFVANARETGSLASWLSQVEVRLRRWWDIVKNIGATLFNYSSAASDFGDWLSEGLLETTERWREASEEAKKEGSPFKAYLEDVKPLLQEIKGLFGDLFGWFRQEIMDPQNIEDAIDLISLLRTELGPALANLFDTLAKTEIDEKLIHAITLIVETLNSLLENGGGAAFEAFFDVVNGGFTILKDVISAIPEPVIKALLGFLGFVAGVSFVGKFTGLTAMLGAIPTAAAGAKKLYGWFKKIAGTKFGNILGKAGLFAGIAAVVAGGVNQVVESADVVNKTKEAQKEHGYFSPESREAFSTDGTMAKGLTGGWIASGILGLLGLTEWQAELDSFFVDLSGDMHDGMGNISMTVGSELGRIEREWDTTWGTIMSGWNTFWGNFNGVFQIAWNNLSNWFNNTFIIPIQNAWSGFQSALLTGWTWLDQNVFQPFGRVLDPIKTAFDTGVTWLGDTWGKLSGMFSSPIQFVVDTVYNNGIRKFWNTVAGTLGMGTLPEHKFDPGPTPGGGRGRVKRATGGVLPGYTPGRDVHTFFSPKVGTLELSGGEAIMRPEWTRAVGGPAAVDRMNRRAINGVRDHGNNRLSYRTGGVLGALSGARGRNPAPEPELNDWQKFGIGVANTSLNIADGMSALFSDPLGTVVNGLNAIINPLLKGIPGFGTPYGNMASGIPRAMVKAAGTKAKKSAESVSASSGAFFGGAVGKPGFTFGTPSGDHGSPAYMPQVGQAMYATVAKQFPWVNLHNSLRNWGSRYHKTGRAIDISPSMDVFNWIAANWPNSRQLIYTPAGGRQLENGRRTDWRFDPSVGPMHNNHIHWAMANGGVLPEGMGLYDNGGWLQPGKTAINLTGKPEAVLDPDESRGLKALLSGSGLGRGVPALSASPGLSLSNGPQRVVDNSVNVDKLIVQNPVPERTSDSLPRAIRKMAYMSNARGER